MMSACRAGRGRDSRALKTATVSLSEKEEGECGGGGEKAWEHFHAVEGQSCGLLEMDEEPSGEGEVDGGDWTRALLGQGMEEGRK